ncbi:Potassium channel [Coemansia biformis]|uniref:Potassium channel n=1 Tax=Coemansia biformis TaxID=1286918 RepID=A0A9W8CUN1_9FUNG|nr:Potassium channel [Coemansia biformis]
MGPPGGPTPGDGPAPDEGPALNDSRGHAPDDVCTRSSRSSRSGYAGGSSDADSGNGGAAAVDHGNDDDEQAPVVTFADASARNFGILRNTQSAVLLSNNERSTSPARMPPAVPHHGLAPHAEPGAYGAASETSTNEPLGSPRTSDSSPEMEDLWFQRARTFSVAEVLEPAAGHAGDRRPPESIHTLPRVATVVSAKERDDDDDLPPMRLGREITNDLRNIQLTFDQRTDSKRSSGNPLRHLLRSKHNYRALVTYGGYLFPINILLNVILLGRGWLQLTTANPDDTHSRVNNPVGYLITSIISLILIVVSGVCFILRCLEFDVMMTTQISVFSNFANAALILVSAIIYLKTERPKHPDAQLTGEYYCSYAGAAVALLNAALLLLDIVVTPGFRYRGSGMSRQQRMLQLNLIVVVVWIGIGGYVWSKIEDWDTVTSVMFCMVTVTTIGYGNISPTKTYSRILQLIYGPIGILMFGMMLLNTRNVIMQLTRDTFKVARRDFEARRSRIQQDITAARVRRRLAVRPERRGLRSMLNDLLGRVFLSRNERMRVGIPHWLRNTFDEDTDHVGSADLEAGEQRGDMHADDGDPGQFGLPRDRQQATGSHDAPGEDSPAHASAMGDGGNITFATAGSRKPSSQLHTGLGMHRIYSLQHQSDAAEQNDAPHQMERTYTSASRLSHVREVLARSGKRHGIRRRLGLRRRDRSADARRPERGGEDSSAASDGDSDAEASGNEGGRGDAAGLDAGQTLQPGGTTGGPRREPYDADVTPPKAQSRGKDKERGGGAQARHRWTHGRRDLVKQLWVALALNVVFWLSSSGIFYAIERDQWSYFDAMWYGYVTFTTIGYGDVVPKTTEGMVAFICLCFVAVGLETFLVVSGVTLCTDMLNQAMKRTRVQRRIARHKKGLVAYEIRRHIKHPNYNPFGRGDDEGMLATGFRRLRHSLRHAGEVLRGRRPAREAFSRHRTKDQRARDEKIAAGFIRHTTGMGGFAGANWQPPSRSPSPVSVVIDPAPRHHSAHPAAGGHARSTPVPAPVRPFTSMQPAACSRRDSRSSERSSPSESFRSSPEDIIWTCL